VKHDQAAADRERIAGFANPAPGIRLWFEPDDLRRLDAAVRAFELLCEPRGWGLNMMTRGDHRQKVWYVQAPQGASLLDDMSNAMDESWYAKSGSHAADVCRLVCEVLDREAKEPRP
jgi:hypothetical protein